MLKNFYGFGILTVIFYVLAVILGGFLIPDYNHVNQVISEIDPLLNGLEKFIVNLIFIFYNFFGYLFGLGMYKKYVNKRISFKLQAICILILNVAGFLMIIFPMGSIGSTMTLSWCIHIVLATISTPLTIIICLLGFWAFKDIKMKFFSFGASILISIFSIISFFYIVNLKAGMGLFERVVTGIYFMWLLICSLHLKRKS